MRKAAAIETKIPNKTLNGYFKNCLHYLCGNYLMNTAKINYESHTAGLKPQLLLMHLVMSIDIVP